MAKFSITVHEEDCDLFLKILQNLKLVREIEEVEEPRVSEEQLQEYADVFREGFSFFFTENIG